MKTFNRRQFIRLSATGIAASVMLPNSLFANNFDAATEVIANTTYGKIKGFRLNGVSSFKGVPYAGKVSGERRFLPPAALQPWKGIRDAQKLGNPSIQIPNQTYGINEPEPAEDCLTLNIWTPSTDGKKRAVMVYNHGGGYINGSAGSVAQDGSNLAQMFDVVVVASNHRLGLLGYLYLDEIAGEEYKGSGNRRIQDIAYALSWVHDNINAFGGDPNNVIIFGESGGGLKTSCLCAMPQAAAFFNKASIESGPGVKMKSAEFAAQTTELLLNELNINAKDWRKLLDLPASALLDAQVKLQAKNQKTLFGGFDGIGAAGLGSFGPVVDGYLLPNHPFEPNAPDISKDKPLLTGWNEDEQIFFSMFGGDMEAFKLTDDGLEKRLESNFGDKTSMILETYRTIFPNASPSELYIKINSLLIMGLGSLKIADKKFEQKGAAVYLYNFGYKSEVKVPGTDFEFGAMHAMDIQFKFYNIGDMTDKSGKTSSGMAGNRKERFQASMNMCSFWTSFAKTGIPKADKQPTWTAYNSTDKPLMRIDTDCQVINNRFKSELELWNKIFEK